MQLCPAKPTTKRVDVRESSRGDDGDERPARGILLLQAILVMGILSLQVDADYFPECCDKCSNFSGVDVCDDVRPSQVPRRARPVKMFRCADMRSTIDGTCGPSCKKHR
ncbi:hypothetical protein ZWY2020_009895 [Hordeum vulgare]|nr:hypothetical protein ZWY2020_009895 [Hordeum vulgare]